MLVWYGKLWCSCRIQPHTLSVVFEDGFNDHIQIITQEQKQYIQLIRMIVTQALCLTSDSPVLKSDGTIVEVGDLSEGDVLKGYAFDSLMNILMQHFLIGIQVV